MQKGDERLRKVKYSLSNTVNSINCTAQLAKYYGKTDVQCPICQQSKEWLHVVLCRSPNEQKEDLVMKLQAIRYQELERHDRNKAITEIKEYLSTSTGNETLLKMLY